LRYAAAVDLIGQGLTVVVGAVCAALLAPVLLLSSVLMLFAAAGSIGCASAHL